MVHLLYHAFWQREKKKQDTAKKPEEYHMLSCKAKQLRCLVIIGVAIAVFLLVLLVLLVTFSFVIKENSCPPEISTNVTVTPCYYDELKGTQLQATSIVQLPNDYFLKVVDRRGTSSLCVLHRSSTNTTFTLQLVTSVEDSPLCSPEQMLDCLPSSHVSFNSIEYFGVSVMDQQSSSVHYLVVNISSWITYQRNLTNTFFNLQDLWYNALNCKEHYMYYWILAVLVIFLAVIIYIISGYWAINLLSCRTRGYNTDDDLLHLLPAYNVSDSELDEDDDDDDDDDDDVEDTLQDTTVVSLPAAEESEQGHVTSKHNMETEQELHLEETEEIHGPVQVLVPVEVHVDGRLQNRDRDLQRGDPFRTSSTSLVSAKSEQGHQCQSKLVGHYATSQLCPDSPPPRGQRILDRSSPSRMSGMSYSSVKSEQERDQGELALHTNPVYTVKRSSCSPNLSTDAVRSSQQQILLQGIEDHVLLRVAAEWEPLATYLGVEPDYIDIIKKNNLLDCVGACRELFRSWINKEKGTGREHRTWDSVVRAIRKMGKEGLADELTEK